jgi:Cu2+-exporting ATPase
MPTSFLADVTLEKDGLFAVAWRVEGLHCAGCVRRVLDALEAQPDVSATLDLASAQLNVRWKGEATRVDPLADSVRALGYGLVPLFNETPADAARREEKRWKICLIVAGAGLVGVMGLMAVHATRPFPHAALFAALWGVPTTLIAAAPFLIAALRALARKTTTMDVPIAVALLLTLGLNLAALARDDLGAPAFDAGLMLTFLLLLGRWLDFRTRRRAQNAAEDLLSFLTGEATILPPDTLVPERVPIRRLQPGMLLLAAAGEKLPADGCVIEGRSDVDVSFITGETDTRGVGPSDELWGGSINLTAPLKIRLTRTGSDSLPGEILKLMAKAQQNHSRAVRFADRAARLYTPFVFTVALLGFGGWIAVGAPWTAALQVATALLVITCPCALGLAVPAVQIAASTRLFQNGLLLKAGDALERLAAVDTIVFDKTGTLTLGKPRLVESPSLTPERLAVIAALATHSRHPLAKALAHHLADVAPATLRGIVEKPGLGLEAEGSLRLGRRSWCGAPEGDDARPELWFDDGQGKVRFAFDDTLRADAASTIATLRERGYQLHLLSGDRAPAVAALAAQIGLDRFRAACTPADKASFVEELQKEGRHVLMVGDGLNDTAALAMADVSLSPATGLDVAQNAAALVFQHESLNAVPIALTLGCRAQRLVRQNIALAVLYNVIAIPVAALGLATPAFAAAAMALSSITVVLNARRI